MLIKDSAAPVADAADDGGDDDDARSCDSISGEKPQAACDDAEQMQRCSSSFGAVAAAIVKLQAEYVFSSRVCQWCFFSDGALQVSGRPPQTAPAGKGELHHEGECFLFDARCARA